MAIYLRQFETAAQYEAAESTLATPNVSLIAETNGVAYKPYVEPISGTSNGHEWINIGGVKWARTNVGANSETSYGIYARYETTSSAITVNWGGNWRMPTKDEFELLIASTNYTWETNFNGSGKKGGKFTDKTDSSKYVFFPAAGVGNYGSVEEEGTTSNIWSSTTNGSSYVYRLRMNSNTAIVNYVYATSYDLSVRPVLG